MYATTFGGTRSSIRNPARMRSRSSCAAIGADSIWTTRVRFMSKPRSSISPGVRLVPGRLKITKLPSRTTALASCQPPSWAAASEPSSSSNRCPGKRVLSSRMVSIVYEVPPRSISRREATTPGWPATASSTMRIRSAAPATGSARCGGRALGISHTCSRSATSRKARAASRWPLWTGSKVPPMTPIRRSSPGDGFRSAVRVVEKLQLRNPNRVPTLGAVSGQGLVQAPAFDHSLEVRQALRVGEVRHRDQLLQLISRDLEATIDSFDGEGLCRARAAIDLECGERFCCGVLLSAFQHSPGGPQEILHPLAADCRNRKSSAAKLDHALPEGGDLGGIPHDIHLVERDQVRTTSQCRGITLQLRAHLLVVVPEFLPIPGRGIQHVNQQPCSLHVSEKLQAQAGSRMRAFDQTGKVGHDEVDTVLQLDDAEHGFERREGVVCDLRLGGARYRQQRRLARVRQSDQADIGDQLQLQPEPEGLTRLSELGKARRLPGGGLEAGVTPPAPAGLRHHEPLVWRNQVRERLALLVLDDGSWRNFEHQVGAFLALSPAPATM